MARPRWRIPGRGSRAGGPLPRSQAPVRQRVIAATMSLAWITAAAASVPHVRLTAGNACLLAVLLVSALLVRLPRSDRTAPGVPESTSGAWELPAAVLLPPTLAFTAPVAVTAIACWRLRRVPRKLDAVVAGLADGIVSLSFHALAPPLPVPGIRAVAWLLAVAAAGAMRWALICAVFLAVTYGARPELPRLPADRELLRGGLAELCAGILITCSAVISPLCVIIAVPLATPLQRSLQYTRLVHDARTDLKTGLLNAAAWQEEAAVEIARAVRARHPLAVALLDIDHFKAVNDTHGHLAGDQALRAVAGVVKAQLRGYDIAGRYGGEEFAVVLPHTQADQARRIAERLRMAVAAADVGGSETGRSRIRLCVTVSVGVACLADTGPGLQALVAAADAALYDAKAAGRNRVRLTASQPTTCA